MMYFKRGSMFGLILYIRFLDTRAVIPLAREILILEIRFQIRCQLVKSRIYRQICNANIPISHYLNIYAKTSRPPDLNFV